MIEPLCFLENIILLLFAFAAGYCSWRFIHVALVYIIYVAARFALTWQTTMLAFAFLSLLGWQGYALTALLFIVHFALMYLAYKLGVKLGGKEE